MHRAQKVNTKHVDEYKMSLWPREESQRSCNPQDRRSRCCSTSTNACAAGGACEHNGWIQTACFGARRNDSRTCVTLEPIMRNTHKLYILCLVPWASLRKPKQRLLRNRKRRGVRWSRHNDDNVPQGFSVVLSQDCKDSRQARENMYLCSPGSWAHTRLSGVIKIWKCINAIPVGDYNMRQAGMMACANGLKLRAICLFLVWISWICRCDWRVSAYIVR